MPTSYMCLGSSDDFFGGYDHGVGAGFVHWADHRVSPGKKQWTWGNDPFGWAWDRNLTDTDGPYVELMAGVYTDNQPDFTFLLPGETKTFSQYWYPIQGIGAAHQATLEGAVHLSLDGDVATLNFVPTRAGDLRLTLDLDDGEVWAEDVAAAPGEPVLRQVRLPRPADLPALTATVRSGDEVLLAWRPAPSPTTSTCPTRRPSSPPGQHRQHRRALPHRRAPRAVPARHPLPGALLGRGAAPRPRRHPHQHGDGRPSLPRRKARRGGDAPASGSRTPCQAQPQPRDGEAHYLLGLVLLARGDLRGRTRPSAGWLERRLEGAERAGPRPDRGHHG
ncbi:DUF5107 domain-containing protein [Tessaracoccus sp. HDW20]|nr:DUF5107 domain-containing protein [Tessaracoccus coleopterorum]